VPQTPRDSGRAREGGARGGQRIARRGYDPRRPPPPRLDVRLMPRVEDLRCVPWRRSPCRPLEGSPPPPSPSCACRRSPRGRRPAPSYRPPGGLSTVERLRRRGDEREGGRVVKASERPVQRSDGDRGQARHGRRAGVRASRVRGEEPGPAARGARGVRSGREARAHRGPGVARRARDLRAREEPDLAADPGAGGGHLLPHAEAGGRGGPEDLGAAGPPGRVGHARHRGLVRGAGGAALGAVPGARAGRRGSQADGRGAEDPRCAACGREGGPRRDRLRADRDEAHGVPGRARRRRRTTGPIRPRRRTRRAGSTPRAPHLPVRESPPGRLPRRCGSSSASVLSKEGQEVVAARDPAP
jgi:hypothetical protein